MTITELTKRYSEGAGATTIIEEIWERMGEWNDPALFLFIPEKDSLLKQAAALGEPDEARPLWGIPFVVKDNIDVEGWPTTAGCPDYAYTAGADSEVVRLLREAGALVVGKGNLDQFATGLVGTRSPHGTARNAVAPGWLPGGSSSGSASAVAAGLCCFSLGTDTAGSGRVPAAFQELIGWKPSRGLLSARGVVPACRSLDCISVFANDVHDAAAVMEVVGRYDEADPYSRHVDALDGVGVRMGIPKELDFSGDPDTPELYEEAKLRAFGCGATAVPIDLQPFLEAARLLYEGPWVAERWVAVGEFVEESPESVFPITRKILEASKNWDAASAYRARDRLREIAREVEKIWETIDFMLLPTTPCLYTVDEVEADPLTTNSTLGRYTNFMNLLDLAAVALPAGRARCGKVPWGVTLAAPAGKDAGLLDWAASMTGETPPVFGHSETRLEVVVCGAHLAGMALNHQLTGRGGRMVWQGKTAPVYRMYAMPPGDGFPARPAMMKVGEGGSSIEVEIWSLGPSEFGGFVASIPGPLGIGKIELENGREVSGFIAESRATEDAEDITSFGGWRAWIAASL